MLNSRIRYSVEEPSVDWTAALSARSSRVEQTPPLVRAPLELSSATWQEDVARPGVISSRVTSRLGLAHQSNRPTVAAAVASTLCVPCSRACAKAWLRITERSAWRRGY